MREQAPISKVKRGSRGMRLLAWKLARALTARVLVCHLHCTVRPVALDNNTDGMIRKHACSISFWSLVQLTTGFMSRRVRVIPHSRQRSSQGWYVGVTRNNTKHREHNLPPWSGGYTRVQHSVVSHWAVSATACCRVSILSDLSKLHLYGKNVQVDVQCSIPA